MKEILEAYENYKNQFIDIENKYMDTTKLHYVRIYFDTPTFDVIEKVIVNCIVEVTIHSSHTGFILLSNYCLILG